MLIELSGDVSKVDTTRAQMTERDPMIWYNETWLNNSVKQDHVTE